MSIRSSDIGQVAKAFPCTRISNAPGGKQTVNLFQQDEQFVMPTRKVRAPPGGSSSKDNFLAHHENENAPPSNIAESNLNKSTEDTPKKSRVAPGGNSSLSLAHQEFVPSQTKSNNSTPAADSTPTDSAPTISDSTPSVPKPMRSNIFSNSKYATMPRSSTRIHVAPAGPSAMANIFNHEQADEPTAIKTKPNPQQKSTIFEDTVTFKSSTKRILAPGGQSTFSFTAEDTVVQQQTFHTARANQSKNIFDLSPPERSRRPVNPERNKSSNVINLTPKAQNRTLPRPAKALEPSMLTEEPKPICVSKYAMHNKMMHSDIFSEAPFEQTSRSSVRMHQPSGGSSTQIF